MNVGSMKIPMLAILLVTFGFLDSQAQSDFQMDTYYLTTSQGLDVFVNDRSAGKTPLILSLSEGQRSTLDFRRNGRSVMRMIVHPNRVANVRNARSAPNWYGNEHLARGHGGYTLASASASSRSLSISINKAKNDAINNIGDGRRGNRQASSRPGLASQALSDAQILECYILFDDSSFHTFVLVGLPN
jgi:hypothetical protein